MQTAASCSRFQNTGRVFKVKCNPHRAQRLCLMPTRATTEVYSTLENPIIKELPPKRFDDYEILKYEQQKDGYVELVVVGNGPAGIALADRVSRQGLRVCVVDPDPLGEWPNNYGVWVDEFRALGHDDCFDIEWSKAVVHLGESEDQTKYLYRPYARVDKYKLKDKLLKNCIKQGVMFHEARGTSVRTDGGESYVQCSDGTTITASIVVDATGHKRQLVQFDQTFDPGYQGAYGITAVVDSHPFDLDTAVFMDWRSQHTDKYPKLKEANDKTPTFLYVMPMTDNKIFLEETSLVARPAVPFEELKERLWARMEHMGIKVRAIEEQEYCLIPMGGVLPRLPQRVIGVGGTAGMVHPSTGYMVSRALGAVPALADSIVDQLCAPSDPASNKELPMKAANEQEAMEMSELIWSTVWPGWRLRQREFFNFGMEVLLKLDLEDTQEFFKAFFQLTPFHWEGFLSARLTFPELIVFGLALFKCSSMKARLDLMAKGAPGFFTILTKLPSMYSKA